MNRKLLITLFIATLACVTYSCKKIIPSVDPARCEHATDGLIVKKWASAFIQTDTYNSSGTKTNTSFDHPAGFIQFKNDATYTIVSDGILVNGSWLFDHNCNLALTAGGSTGVTFEVVTLTTDSLIIRKKVNNLVVTQHFGAYSCSYQPYMVKKWVNTYIQQDNYSSDGATVVSSNLIYPIGFFELNSDSTYRVVSNNVPLNGKWSMNIDKCDLTLDAGTSLARTFEIVKASADSLIIRRKAGNVAYIQHYKAYNCPTLAQLEQQWDNIDIRTDYVTNGTLSGSNYIYPTGYFKLNANLSYNVLSSGATLDGSWLLLDQSHGCPLVLDQATSLERSFDIIKITSDSLTIYREDIINQSAYTQRYKKH